jgi:hypothetical protein
MVGAQRGCNENTGRSKVANGVSYGGHYEKSIPKGKSIAVGIAFGFCFATFRLDVR